MHVAALPTAVLSDRHLDLLAEIGVRSALALVAVAREDTEWTALDAIISACDRECARLRRAGIDARAAWGLAGPVAAHRPTAPLWGGLAAAIAAGTVSAVGPLGGHLTTAGARVALRAQLQVAARAGVGVLLHPTIRHRRAATSRLLRAALEAGVPPSRIDVIGADVTSARPVLDAGARLLLPLGLGVEHDELAMALAERAAARPGARVAFCFPPLPIVPDLLALARLAESVTRGERSPALLVALGGG
jgi:predicted metal-dependent TIM-barrel fold hydrolase